MWPVGRFALASFSLADRLPASAVYEGVEAPLSLMLAAASEASMTRTAAPRPAAAMGPGAVAAALSHAASRAEELLCTGRMQLRAADMRITRGWLSGRISELAMCIGKVVSRPAVDLAVDSELRRISQEAGFVEEAAAKSMEADAVGGRSAIAPLTLHARPGLPKGASQRAEVSTPSRWALKVKRKC